MTANNGLGSHVDPRLALPIVPMPPLHACSCGSTEFVPEPRRRVRKLAGPAGRVIVESFERLRCAACKASAEFGPELPAALAFALCLVSAALFPFGG